MLRAANGQAKLSFQIDGHVAEDVYTPPRLPTRNDQYSRAASLIVDDVDEGKAHLARDSADESTRPTIWLSEKGDVLCHLHPRHGTVALYTVESEAKRLELVGVMCFKRHYTAPVHSPSMQAFIPAKMRQKETRSQDNGQDYLGWEDFHTTSAAISSLAFCGVGDSVIALLTAMGVVATYRLDRSTGGQLSVTTLSSKHVVEGPTGPFCGVPDRELVVATTSVGGQFYVIDAATCFVVANGKIPGGGMATGIALLPAPPPQEDDDEENGFTTSPSGFLSRKKATKAAAKPLYQFGVSHSHDCLVTILTLRRGESSSDESPTKAAAQGIDLKLEVQVDSVTITNDTSYEMFSEQNTTVELDDFDFSPKEEALIAKLKNTPVTSIVPMPGDKGNGFAAAVTNAAILLFNFRSKSKNICCLIHNCSSMPFTRCCWMQDHQNEAGCMTLAVERSGSSVSFYKVTMNHTKAHQEVPPEFITEWSSPTAAVHFGLSGPCGVVLRARTMHHPLCSSEGAPILQRITVAECEAANNEDSLEDTEGVDSQTAAAHPSEFTIQRSLTPDSITQMRLFDVGGHPMVATVYRCGEVSVTPLGSVDDPVTLRPLVQVNDSAPFGAMQESMVTALLVLPCLSGDLILLTGDEDGVVTVWQRKQLIATCRAHADAVTTIFALPGNSERADAVCASLSYDGSLVLYQSRTFESQAILHAPCANLIGVFWDTVREYCIMVSSSGANVWHVITGKLERCITDDALIDELCHGKPNYLYRHPRTEATSLCEVTRLPMVRHSAFVVTVKLHNVIQTLLNMKSSGGNAAATLSAHVGVNPGSSHRLDSSPTTSPATKSPTSSYVAQPNSDKYKLPATPGTMASESENPFPSVVNLGVPLSPALRAALSFVFLEDDCPDIVSLKEMLGLYSNPAPKVHRLSKEERFCENPVRTAHQYVAVVSVLRALCLAVPPVAHTASQAVLWYSKQLPFAIGDRFVKPSLPTCIDLMGFPSGPMQFAARITINSCVRCSSGGEVDKMYDELHSLPTTHKYVALAAKAIVMVQSTKKEKSELTPVMPAGGAFNSSFSLVGPQRVKEVAMELEREAIVAAEAGHNEAFLGALAEAWMILRDNFVNPHALLLSLFTSFCIYRPTNSVDEYRGSYGAKAVTSIASHDVGDFQRFANRICVDSHSAVDKDIVSTRIAVIYVFMRMIQTHPPKMLQHLDSMLEFVWHCIDPHSPKKSDRERCFPAVAAMFRMAVHCLPMVTFQQHQQRLAIGHTDGTVVVYDVKTTSKLCSFSTGKHPVAAIAYSNIGHDIVTISTAMEGVKLWRQESGGLWGMLSAATSYKQVGSAHKVPSCPNMDKALREHGGTLPLEACMKTFSLVWASPSCLELSSPWHDRLQVML